MVWTTAWPWTRRRKCEWLCSHLYWYVYISWEREKDEAYLSHSTQLYFFVRATPDFIVVHSDSTSVDSDCKTHVHSILKIVNFFWCISLEKLPKKDKKVQTEYVWSSLCIILLQHVPEKVWQARGQSSNINP